MTNRRHDPKFGLSRGSPAEFSTKKKWSVHAKPPVKFIGKQDAGFGGDRADRSHLVSGCLVTRCLLVLRLTGSHLG